MLQHQLPLVTDLGGEFGLLEHEGWIQLATPPGLRRTIADLHDAADWFFAQPEIAKLNFDIRESVGHRGYVPVTEQGGYGDEGERRYEAFDIGREALASDAIFHPLRGVNRWPDHPDFGRVAAGAYHSFAQLADLIAAGICRHLGVDQAEFDRLRTEPISQLRLIRYRDPQLIDLTPQKRSAMGAHTDYEFLTVFHQSTAGLEILGSDGRWIEPMSGIDSLIVMVGDLLEVFSGGRMPSALHRAGGFVQGGRTSIPFFCGADFTARVRAVTGEEQTEVAFGDHLMRQLRRDFPYLRDRLVREPRGDSTDLIDLTKATPFDRLSPFERRRMRRSSDYREGRRT